MNVNQVEIIETREIEKSRIKSQIDELLRHRGEPELFFAFVISRSKKRPKPNDFGIEKEARKTATGDYLSPWVVYDGPFGADEKHEMQKVCMVIDRLVSLLAESE